MNKELILEHYLSQLDRELQALPVGQRAEIITEIRSHILELDQKDPSVDIQKRLEDLGTPKAVAMRYLEQKGVKYWAPSTPRNWIKWIALATFGSVAFVVASALIATFMAIWYFSPIIEVDEKAGKVSFFGKAIQVSEANGNLKIGSFTVGGLDFDDDDSNHMSRGRAELKNQKVQLIKIPFITAKLEVNASQDGVFSWECKSRMGQNPQLDMQAGVMTLALDKLKFAKCELNIPAGTKAELSGINGSVKLDEPQSDIQVNVTNGKVKISPDSRREYDFDVNVLNGVQDDFASVRTPGALKVKVDVVNGAVRKE